MKYTISFHPCDWEEIHPLIEDNIRTHAITIDSFWEDHQLESKHYKMLHGEVLVGYFCIHEGSTITGFYVTPNFASDAQELFAQVKKYEQVRGALVATGDEFFLSHCFDNFTRIEKQAYFFSYTEQMLPPEKSQPVSLRLAKIPEDLETLKKSNGFLEEEIEKRMAGKEHLQIYIAELKSDTTRSTSEMKETEDLQAIDGDKLDSSVVGFGVIEYGRVLTDIASIGMYVCEEVRHQGLATNILFCLRQLVKDQGYRVFSGCWYYNHNSKKSLEAAGAYSKTRLIRFFF